MALWQKTTLPIKDMGARQVLVLRPRNLAVSPRLHCTLLYPTTQRKTRSHTLKQSSCHLLEKLSQKQKPRVFKNKFKKYKRQLLLGKL